MNFVRVKCPICREDNCEVVYDAVGRRGQVYVVICKNDGMVFLNPRWSDEDYEEYYKTEYYPTHTKSLLPRTGILASCIKRCSEYISMSEIGSVLDIGAGEGALFRAFDDRKTKLECKEAIEAEPKYQKELKQLKVEVISRDVDTNWHLGRESKYDFVVMRHVLEHFLYPERVLEKVNSVLSEKGILYLAVPNLIFIRLQRTAYTHFEPAHVSYFSPRTLEVLTNRVGLKTKYMNLENTEIYGIYEKGEKSEVDPPIHSMYHRQMEILKEFMKR